MCVCVCVCVYIYIYSYIHACTYAGESDAVQPLSRISSRLLRY